MHKEFTFQSHPSEDLLEEYAFRRLREEEIAPLEEHLIFCSGCQEALAEIDEYKFLMRTAAARLETSPVAKSPRRLLGPAVRSFFGGVIKRIRRARGLSIQKLF